MEDIHSLYIDYVLKNMNIIGEDPYNVKWISREPILQNNYCKKQKICDLLIGMHDNSGLCLELKKTCNKRSHAVKQLKNGFDLLIDDFGLELVRNKIVYYGGGHISYENVEFPLFDRK